MTKNQKGFTLIEVLISLALLSIIMLSLTGAIYTMGQTQNSIKTRIQSSDDYRLANHLLSQIFQNTSARIYKPENQKDGSRVAYFYGNPEEVTLIGTIPAKYSIGGRHYIKLATEQINGRPYWVIRYKKWNGMPYNQNWHDAEKLILTEIPTTAKLSYKNEEQWLPNWPTQTEPNTKKPILPQAIQITFESQNQPHQWPPMFIAVAPNHLSDTSIIRAAVGGSRSF